MSAPPDPSPAFPIDLAPLLAPEAIVLPWHAGPLLNLLALAWRSDPACTLVLGAGAHDDEVLASAAGLEVKEWQSARPLLLRSLGACERPQGRIELVPARRVYDRLVELSAKRRAAGAQGGRRRADGATDKPPDKQMPSTCLALGKQVLETPLAGAPAGPRAPARRALQRSNSSSNPERSSAAEQTLPGKGQPLPETADGRAVAGAIYDGLEARAEAALAEYRRGQSRDLLERAFARFKAQGRLLDAHGRERRDWTKDLAGIANHPNVRPALVEIAVFRLDRADADADAGPVANPVGYLINALGAHRRGEPLTPYLHDQATLDKWAALERKVFDAERVRASTDQMARRIDRHIDRRVAEGLAERLKEARHA